jgi:hypothetical protein
MAGSLRSSTKQTEHDITMTMPSRRASRSNALSETGKSAHRDTFATAAFELIGVIAELRTMTASATVTWTRAALA